MHRSEDNERFKGHSIFGRGKRSNLVQSVNENYDSVVFVSKEGSFPSFSYTLDEEMRSNAEWFNENYY